MLVKKITPWIIGCGLFCTACFISYQKGVTDTTEKNLRADVNSLNQSFVNFTAAAKQAGELNLQLSHTISARKKADAESTKVFANALAATSHLRFNCVFDDFVMHQISEAADRADEAASSGFAGSLRPSAPPNE